MSMFDHLECNLTCPRCHTPGAFDVELFTPFANLCRYRLGDEITNATKNKIPDHAVYEGYAVCAICQKDFFLKIAIADKKIRSITIDIDKRGYID